MAGNDSYTKLLLHCNGSDGSTTFTDDSDSSHTVTAQNNAEIDTAESKFGGASALFGGGSDRLTIPDDDASFNFGADDWTIDFWAKKSSLGATSHLVGQWEFGNNKMLSTRLVSSNVFDIEYRTDGGSNSSSASTFTLSDTDWHHYAVVRDGNTLRFFVDGVAEGTDDWTGITLNNASRDFLISGFDSGSQGMVGWLDEVRVSKGIARWTSGFTPPTEEYSSPLNTANIEETVLINYDQSIVIPTKNINESVLINSTNEDLSGNIDAKFASKIISINPLIIVTNTDPMEVIKVDTTNPSTPTFDVRAITGVSNATDVSYNTNNSYLYVSCADGKIVKIDINNLSNQTIVDLGDTDNLLSSEVNDNFQLSYFSTDDENAELYILDERDTYKIDSDLRMLTEETFSIDSDITLTNGFFVDSDIRLLGESTFVINTDLKILTNEVDDVEPVKETDFSVFIDDVELSSSDLDLSSITVTTTVDKEQEASFKLTRNHDNFNKILEDDSSFDINSKNKVVIKINDTVIFPLQGTGKIFNLSPEYGDSSDDIIVKAKAELPDHKFNNVTLSLPSKDKRLTLYDILSESTEIFNPFIDPDDDEPRKFLGIKASLGQKTTQSLIRLTEFDSFGSDADAILEGTFNLKQNLTYFWSPTVTRFGNFTLGQTSSVTFSYIGTSLSPVFTDTWDLTNAKHRKQRIFEDIVTELGEYSVGSAPFRTINPRNGVLVSKYRWVDEEDGLYSVKDASYNLEDYVKEIVDLEYEKLLNINGDILPETISTITVPVDAYLFYDINLLTRINIDNTISEDIYKDNNGFPVAVKGITINSRVRKAVLTCDNLLSQIELDEIEGEEPDPEDDRFNEEEKRIFLAPKTDMKTLKPVE